MDNKAGFLGLQLQRQPLLEVMQMLTDHEHVLFGGKKCRHILFQVQRVPRSAKDGEKGASDRKQACHQSTELHE